MELFYFTIKLYFIDTDTGVGAVFKVLVLYCSLHLGRRRQAPTKSDLLLIVDNPFKVLNTYAENVTMNDCLKINKY